MQLRPKRWYRICVFFKQKHKTAQFCFCGLNQRFAFFHFFLPMIKKINTFFFTSVFTNSKNHHPLFRLISSKRRVSFKHRFAMPKHAYFFWELFTVLVAFSYPQNVCLVVPWTDVIIRQNTVHLENRKACKNVDIALHHSQSWQTWRVCFALLKQHLQHNVKIRWDWWGGSLVKLDQSWYW